MFSNFLLGRSSLEKQLLGVGFKFKRTTPHVKNIAYKLLLQRVVLVYTATGNATVSIESCVFNSDLNWNYLLCPDTGISTEYFFIRSSVVG